MEWLKRQGPWVPGLIEYLRRQHQQYDVLVFFTYLYAPTVLGLEIAPARSILVPTAHDEPAIRLEIFKEVFRKPAALCYLTDSERRFVEMQFPERPLLEEVGRRRRRSAAAAALPADADAPDEDGRRRADGADARTPTKKRRRATSRRTCSRAAPSSAAGTGSTARSSSTAAASTRARAARS